jgi:predicted DNA-binding antitoxin AbrB/MazE fold protein
LRTEFWEVIFENGVLEIIFENGVLGVRFQKC